jgi:hypothetical protein
MFFAIFWTVYVPIAIVILSLVSEWLKQALREVDAAPLASSPRSRPGDSWSNDKLHRADAIAFALEPRRPHSRSRR